MTDCELVLTLLREAPRTNAEILAASFAKRGCGLTVHSRVADVRRRLEAGGETVACRAWGRTAKGRPLYRYEIVPLGDRQLELV